MLQTFSSNTILEFVSLRDGESKLGEHVQTIHNNKNVVEELKATSATFIILGVPEDIGVQMNYGNAGAHTAFIPALQALLNTQQNQFINGNDILILGYLDFLDEVIDFNPEDRNKGNELLKKLDTELSKWISIIVQANKIPIVIGGGHNNSYGNIKGFSEALNQSVNVINLDAHTDLRKLEERHSGNGFSYALQHGFLDKYFMFGLHENYTPQYIFDLIHNNINLEYNMFEEIAVYKSTTFESELQRALNFIAEKPFGIEIDLDCIQSFPSSAMTPSGFSPEEARRVVYFFGKHKSANYLHVCEGAPSLSNEKLATKQVGKYISYLITDFIKSKTN
ncbi:formimidoylglutamase [Tenacibaculum jejuense]|uniref:Formimidoylglutamase n=1 Tax=Tenacibaculum jejuense TaxID=584609 RepID=A0A238U9C0_9FLAO|nr:formimidoylglutamase [Tenacibaculum jejuense]SNR15596.1 Formimidoylglutamase [Tenacibaculum jejuense]